ncbi:hypothetical protein [Rhizobium multihospitium]|uniref:Uncharacterized protein n=1 Tax=Rhizobium multihospitium TaxID=410764 RepID=A0A1C3WWK1_9HYPH|nr:hypothetical protein [Rhizobium multihospitium]SCB44397.1 hypothetical protein GA0061103_6478 [Rhizobium multihospitium]
MALRFASADDGTPQFEDGITDEIDCWVIGYRDEFGWIYILGT